MEVLLVSEHPDTLEFSFFFLSFLLFYVLLQRTQHIHQITQNSIRFLGITLPLFVLPDFLPVLYLFFISDHQPFFHFFFLSFFFNITTNTMRMQMMRKKKRKNRISASVFRSQQARYENLFPRPPYLLLAVGVHYVVNIQASRSKVCRIIAAQAYPTHSSIPGHPQEKVQTPGYIVTFRELLFLAYKLLSMYVCLPCQQKQVG